MERKMARRTTHVPPVCHEGECCVNQAGDIVDHLKGMDMPELDNRMWQYNKRLQSNRAGEALGCYSICSANRFVLESALFHARVTGALVCIESTSNQVNQLGGYMGMTPEDFRQYVFQVAGECGCPTGRIVLGGDHLGPHVWQSEPAASAMEKACTLVESCVLAGYTKIHLDASMRLGDDPAGALDEKMISERTARLCQAAEKAWSQLPSHSPLPLYVIGSEVPIPGGEQAEGDPPQVTEVANVGRTLEMAQGAFAKLGLSSAWERVVALVVQPGVEFGDSVIFAYDPDRTQGLSQYVKQLDALVYEAHSTDYQQPALLNKMVADHFAILKVGPWLTFALREAIYALELLEIEWLRHHPGIHLSGVRQTVESVMLQNPVYWEKYYRGDAEERHFARHFSFSDRLRYYWPQPPIPTAVARLLENLSTQPMPLSLLSQFLPVQYAAVRAGAIRNHPREIIHARIAEVLRIYDSACGGNECVL
jgi:D-tagatose-1,6-bisphosphate aldolase subunit GatZ/KbaZ